ncbi:conjugal transfer protein TraN [Sphingomonas sp. IC081]|jgi:conjugal transfer mating pair stabilization protein TraN|uniref:conjugal transfer protein TraN n=1 Tax=Sphingomonas sp. IC081 TaxID=304378 RepID=UPI00115B01B5|nr:conjugal transfer protein TraN [Sphingomonas sp. IC081]QDK31674.1 conjugal transfer protein TraN [Sphingomonas sp. IC081]
MKRLLLPLFCLACACLPTSVSAQTTTDAAKADGKAFGRDQAAATQSAATTDPDANRIPNFGGVPNQSDYFEDPDRMAREAASQASANTGYRTMRDSMDRRAKFNKVDLDAAIARSKTIAEDPLSYTSGMGVSGTQGRCVPLPPASGTAARYKATCNTGYTVDSSTQSCAVTLQTSVTTVTDYLYYCSRLDPDCTAFQLPTCRRTGSHPGKCLQGVDTPGGFKCFEPGDPVDEYTCSAPVTGETPIRVSTRQSVSTTKDESQCAGLAADNSCQQDTETCTDSDPVTRIVDGIAVTQPCWAWSRSYTCAQFTQAQDCQTLESTPGCSLVREDCLSGEPCKTWERVYDCPVPDQPADTSQFICDGDVYCIDGSCETIEREANDEFKDAVVALNAMDQARREFDPDTLTLFKGTRNTCSSKVFGVLNCCKGKGFPLIPGIQLLVALGCSREEMLLHQRDAQGLCAYVGTYCSDSFLGVCLTKKKVYCCFESKLSRILQEQGRQQLNKPWGKPKTEQCLGFTIDEFSRLDLSKMDFSEVYAEFTDAARLPDELQAATEIQQKIEDYYARASQ